MRLYPTRFSIVYFFFNFYVTPCIRFVLGWRAQVHVRPIARSILPSHYFTTLLMLDAALLFTGIWMPLHKHLLASPTFHSYSPVCNPTTFSRT
ncbi:hypothetical protein EV401DRAFT_1914817 [Pisolithus croceorrhizus]|nr:hypothetical protein EV401DRAFT_1914817 [Pisolithus croceorrhizus]